MYAIIQAEHFAKLIHNLDHLDFVVATKKVLFSTKLCIVMLLIEADNHNWRTVVSWGYAQFVQENSSIAAWTNVLLCKWIMGGIWEYLLYPLATIPAWKGFLTWGSVAPFSYSAVYSSYYNLAQNQSFICSDSLCSFFLYSFSVYFWFFSPEGIRGKTGGQVSWRRLVSGPLFDCLLSRSWSQHLGWISQASCWWATSSIRKPGPAVISQHAGTLVTE